MNQVIIFTKSLFCKFNIFINTFSKSNFFTSIFFSSFCFQLLFFPTHFFDQKGGTIKNVPKPELNISTFLYVFIERLKYSRNGYWQRFRQIVYFLDN